MPGGLVQRLWQRDRVALGVMAVGSLVATLAWRGVTRPMADTVSYRAGAVVLQHGWETITDRTPGYPLVLIVTGSADRSTHLLFFVQLLMHVISTCLMVDIARQVGVGRNGRVVLAALLQAPVVMIRVVYEGTEATSALLLTLLCWLLLRPVEPAQRLRRGLAVGLTCGASAMVRPTFALLFVPAALLALWLWTDGRPGAAHRRPWASIAAAAAPALVLVIGLSAYNGARFDSPTLTPLTAYHLSSRTSPYVENLPQSFEPARSVLIRERDRALLRGESNAPANFIWGARPALAKATGLRGRALDRYVMRMDLELIVNNPFSYLDTVKTASVNYTSMDSQGAVLGLGRPGAWLQQAFHQVLLVLFVGVLALVPGLVLARRVPLPMVRALAVGVALCAYTGLVSVLVETGTARLRSPSEPILALVLVVAAAAVRPSFRRRST